MRQHPRALSAVGGKVTLINESARSSSVKLSSAGLFEPARTRGGARGAGAGMEHKEEEGTRTRRRKDAVGGSANTLRKGQHYGLLPTANNAPQSIDYLSSFSPYTLRGRASQISPIKFRQTQRQGPSALRY